MKRITNDEYNRRFISQNRDIEHIGVYVTRRVKTTFKCKVCSHIWDATPDSVLRGSGCPNCHVERHAKRNAELSKSRSLSKDTVNDRLKTTNRPYQLIGEYINTDTPTDCLCLTCGNVWKVRPVKIMYESGCPECAAYGYNTGLPGALYILSCFSFIKYGITNDIERRLKEHRRNMDFTEELVLSFEDGKNPLMLETMVKRKFGGSFVTKEILPDGHTETLCITQLQEVKNFISSIS